MSKKNETPLRTSVTQRIRSPRGLGYERREALADAWHRLVENQRFQITLTVILGILTVLSATYGDRIASVELRSSEQVQAERESDPSHEADQARAPDVRLMVSIGDRAPQDILATHDFVRLALADSKLGDEQEKARNNIAPIWIYDEDGFFEYETKLRTAMRSMRRILCAEYVDELRSAGAFSASEGAPSDGTPEGATPEDAGSEAEKLQRTCQQEGLAPTQLDNRKRVAAACSAEAIVRFAQEIGAEDFSAQDCRRLAQAGAHAEIDRAVVRYLSDLMAQPITGDREQLAKDLEGDITFYRRHGRNDELQSNTDILRSAVDISELRQKISRDEAFQIQADSFEVIGTPNEELRGVIRKLVGILVVPNTTYDEDTTERLRNDEVRRVIPSLDDKRFKRGQIIVSQGQTITPEHAATIQQMNHNAPRIVPWGWDAVGLALLLGLAIFSIGAASKTFGYTWSTRNIAMMGALLLTNILIVRVGIAYADWAHLQETSFFSRDHVLLALPYAMGAIIVSAVVGTGNGVAFAIILSLVVAAMTRYELSWFLLPLLSSLSGCVAAHKIEKRDRVFKASMFATFSMALLTVSFIAAGAFPKILLSLPFGAAIVLSLTFNFILAFALQFAVETIFAYTTTFRLHEWLSGNNRLMDELSHTGGTFSHSQNVGLLVKDACKAIGADALLAQVGALYHDIGKTKSPLYFAENQSGYNPHDELSERESAKIIIGHVTEGVRLAKAAKLPKELIDFIRTHHGTALVRHFYQKTCNAEGTENVAENDFRYPGPLPFTKETAILMLADGIEAAVRSMKNHTDETIRERIDLIVKVCLKDGQLQDSTLTIGEIATVKEAFFARLKGMYHSRPEYAQPTAPAVDKVIGDRVEAPNAPLSDESKSGRVDAEAPHPATSDAPST